MTDLTGAELAMATARVMGKTDGCFREDAAGVKHCMVPRPQDCAPDAVEVFDPLRYKAQAWEVLQWVRRQTNVVAVTFEADGDRGAICMIDPATFFRGPAIGHGPTEAIALCRAVVALGESG